MRRTLYAHLFFGAALPDGDLPGKDVLAERYLGIVGWRGDLADAAESMSDWRTAETPLVYVPTGSIFADTGAFIAARGSVARGRWWLGDAVDPAWMARDEGTLARWRADVLAFQDAVRIPRAAPAWTLSAYEC